MIGAMAGIEPCPVTGTPVRRRKCKGAKEHSVTFASEEPEFAVSGASSKQSWAWLGRAAAVISIFTLAFLAATPASAQAQQQPQAQQQERGFFAGTMQRLVNSLPFTGIFSSRPAPPTTANLRSSGGAPRPQPLPGGQSLLPPPPIPPASIPTVASPDASGAPLALAPPSHAPAETAAPAPPRQVALALSARYNKEITQPINGGIVWRVYPMKPGISGVFRPLREEHHNPSPTLMLPPGDYVVHASLGLTSATKTVHLKGETMREVVDLPAGGIRVEGKVGGVPISAGQISFDIFRGSQFDGNESRPVAQGVMTGEVVIVPEGTYYIVSNYGDANAVIRSDIQVHVGKLTDVTVTHRAAVITLKLLGERGGEALANTSWTVLTPGGDVVKETIGAFPRVALAEGDYRAIARNEGKTFQRDFRVITGVDGEVELLAH
jgi:hypothetical protein